VQSALPVEAGIPFGQTQTFASQNCVTEFMVNPWLQVEQAVLPLVVQSAPPVRAGIPFGQTQTFASQNSVTAFSPNPGLQSEQTVPP